MSEPENDYSWATHLDYMEGAGLDVLTLPVSPAAAAKAELRPQQPAWGVLVALGLTLLAVWLSNLNLWPFTVQVGSRRIKISQRNT